MLRRTTLALAAFALSAAAYGQGPMHDTWDTNAPNGERMAMGTAAPVAAVAAAPMHDTWDIDAPNGPRTAAARTTVTRSPVHGHAAPATAAGRVIEIGPATRYVNVTSGETVLFKVGGKSFTWTFDGTLDHPTFSLARIAPAGLVRGEVTIYCAPTDYERAG